ncbi:hypothetical protein RvY_15681 [Ramazzottius varieornatus]|uniref:Uncharacterized protein n=1 Tax=Ramazzottius varieornatus TaxID=947166 RepID=A0A1D1VXB5_RAMVA|nr:hypothetical protein RvY_15681 [Ramazzottius varieornatus]
MVCIPCILIPAFLWIYHKFIRPYMGPVFVKLEEWMAPLKAKWCPECVDGVCPIKPSKSKSDRLAKVDKTTNKTDSAGEDRNLKMDDLPKVIQKGGFGADVSGLRSRGEQRAEEAQS